jgi:hypothetical protein
VKVSPCELLRMAGWVKMSYLEVFFDLKIKDLAL